MRSIQRMMNLVEKGGRILPFGKLRHAGNWARLMRYWHQGGEENIKNMLTLGAMEYLGFDLPKPPPPRVYPDYGVFDPLSGQSYSDLAAYRSAVPVDPENRWWVFCSMAACIFPRAWYRPENLPGSSSIQGST